MTEIAGNRLHGSGIYEHIYVVGIRESEEKNRDTQIRFIADPPELTFLIANFSIFLMQNNLINNNLINKPLCHQSV